MRTEDDIKRVVARLDIKGQNVVKTVHTEGLRVVGNPADLAAKYYAEGADEIIYMDIVASLYQRDFDFELLKTAVAGVFVPVTAGGGIRTLEDIRAALHSGADKVAVNTYAVRRPNFLKEASEVFGSQCVVLSVEAERVGEGKWEAYTDGGREKTGLDAIEWIRQAAGLGAGEILLSSIDRDGTRSGYDIGLAKAAQSVSPVPVVIHGGAGNAGHMVEAARETGVSAVSVSSVLHYGMETVAKIKKDLRAAGFSVRKT